jgi:hypothetical protein
LYICCRRIMCAKPLPSNECLFWLHYSSFQASYHNILGNEIQNIMIIVMLRMHGVCTCMAHQHLDGMTLCCMDLPRLGHCWTRCNELSKILKSAISLKIFVLGCDITKSVR